MTRSEIMDYLVKTGCDLLEAEFWTGFLLTETDGSTITVDNIETKFDQLPPWGAGEVL